MIELSEKERQEGKQILQENNRLKSSLLKIKSQLAEVETAISVKEEMIKQLEKDKKITDKLMIKTEELSNENKKKVNMFSNYCVILTVIFFKINLILI